MSLQSELRDCADSVTIARTGLLREAADALDALTAENAALKADAELGKIAMRFVDRAGDWCEADPAEIICAEFNDSMRAAIDNAK